MKTYVKIKSSFRMEPYLSLVKKAKYRNAICKIRMNSHHLEIERGRHHKPRIDIKDRLCRKCKVVEDEKHFLTSCENYNDLRHELYARVLKVMPVFYYMDDDEKFTYLICNESQQILTLVGKFIYNAFEVRNDIRKNDN